jgi:hypothetical protein
MVPHWRRFGGAGFFAGFVFACMILISFGHDAMGVERSKRRLAMTWHFSACP